MLEDTGAALARLPNDEVAPGPRCSFVARAEAASPDPGQMLLGEFERKAQTRYSMLEFLLSKDLTTVGGVGRYPNLERLEIPRFTLGYGPDERNIYTHIAKLLLHSEITEVLEHLLQRGVGPRDAWTHLATGCDGVCMRSEDLAQLGHSGELGRGHSHHDQDTDKEAKGYTAIFEQISTYIG